MLLFGWSLIEGIGAALVVPAIVSLIAGTYSGKERALAFGIVGGVAGAAVAAGPLIGGWVTTELSWRYVFAGEVVIVIGILLLRGRLVRAPAIPHPPKLDVVGVAALGHRARPRRLRDPQEQRVGPDRAARRDDDRRHRDHAVRLLGRPVPDPARRRLPRRVRACGRSAASASGRDTLLDRSLLRIRQLRAGLSTLMMQQLILLGTFFVLPVYLQVVLGLDAFETGKRLFPMSVTMFVAAMLGPRLAAGFAPKRVAQAGLVALVLASVLLLGTIDVELNETGFADRARGLRRGRGAAALAARQRDHVVGRSGRRRTRRAASRAPRRTSAPRSAPR